MTMSQKCNHLRSQLDIRLTGSKLEIVVKNVIREKRDEQKFKSKLNVT